MACRCTSTDRRRAVARLVLLSVTAAVALTGLVATPVARAHEPSRINARELVRLAGWFGTPPADAPKVVREVAVTVQGKERVLHAIDWQVYALVVDQQAPIAPAPERVVLQGTREELTRLAAARPEQRIAILAERRPGRSELFLLSVDFCPER